MPRRQVTPTIQAIHAGKRSHVPHLPVHPRTQPPHPRRPAALSTVEAFRVMDDLKAARVPVLILSGGEPLLRPDIFEIAARAKAMGFYTALSSNGTLIDTANIDAIADIDFDYVGVSLDGIQETHDRFRRLAGAFDRSLAGIRLCRERGLKVGVRYTMTQDNAHDQIGRAS